MKNRISLKLSSVTACLLILFILFATSCNQATQQTSSKAKRYHLKGKVVSVDKQSKMVNVDSEAIPDFMDAMTMPYTVKPEGEAEKLAPGDAITADVVVQDEKAWLENITVTGHAPVPTSR